MATDQPPQPEFDRKQIIKLLVELGPLVIFFIVNARYGIFWGTGALMIAMPISLIVSRVVLGHLPVMPVVTTVMVLVFGGLTLVFVDDTFIKMKPTVVNLLFATALFGGLWFKQPLIKYVLGEVFTLTDEGWTQLTIRWGLFFIALAVLNEIVWRNFSTDAWVNFKVWGIMPITMIFAMSQVSFLQRHQLESDDKI
ncbi:MAG: septation protein A [Pseudomonadota bacterium]